MAPTKMIELFLNYRCSNAFTVIQTYSHCKMYKVTKQKRALFPRLRHLVPE